MTTPQGLDNIVATPPIDIQLTTVVVNLLLAGAMAHALGFVYVRCGRSLSNRRAFARTFVLLACTTTLIITVVKSSLALSLGLVGALSIVRFRAAIKEPEELAYLFLTIAIGLGLGANQLQVTIAAFALIVAFVFASRVGRGVRSDHDMLLTVTSDDPTAV
ncbi:MAG: DUF4956 domain-containing protein [bacterium]|nr:DUF4956 domain-containing protein [bacterium]